MTKTLTKADYPADALPLKKRVTSDEEINRALNEISFLKCLLKSITARCKAECDKTKELYSQQMEIRIHGVDIPMVERVTDLQRQIEVYAAEHKEDLLVDGGKTRTFTHGALSWTSSQEKIDYRSGEDAKSVCKKVVEQCGLVKKVIEFLKKLAFGKTKLDQIVELKPSISLSKIKEAWKREEITADELKELGLKVVAPKDSLAVKPGEFEVKSESRTEAKAA